MKAKRKKRVDRPEYVLQHLSVKGAKLDSVSVPTPTYETARARPTFGTRDQYNPARKDPLSDDGNYQVSHHSLPSTEGETSRKQPFPRAQFTDDRVCPCWSSTNLRFGHGVCANAGTNLASPCQILQWPEEDRGMVTIFSEPSTFFVWKKKKMGY